MTVIDSHTHTLRRLAVVDIDPTDPACSPVMLRRGYIYSVGIHPWNAPVATAADLQLVEALALSPQVVAIGETGLDPLRGNGDGGEFSQMQLLEWHARLAERLGKPLILHVVRDYAAVIALRRRMRPSVDWIIHGFRGKPQLALDLQRHGFRLSYGRRYNAEALAMTERPLYESD